MICTHLASNLSVAANKHRDILTVDDDSSTRVMLVFCPTSDMKLLTSAPTQADATMIQGNSYFIISLHIFFMF